MAAGGSLCRFEYLFVRLLILSLFSICKSRHTGNGLTFLIRNSTLDNFKPLQTEEQVAKAPAKDAESKSRLKRDGDLEPHYIDYAKRFDLYDSTTPHTTTPYPTLYYKNLGRILGASLLVVVHFAIAFLLCRRYRKKKRERYHAFPISPFNNTSGNDVVSENSALPNCEETGDQVAILVNIDNEEKMPQIQQYSPDDVMLQILPDSSDDVMSLINRDSSDDVTVQMHHDSTDDVAHLIHRDSSDDEMLQ